MPDLVVYKYVLRLGANEPQAIAMRPSARILCVQEQRGIVYLWALVDNTLTSVWRNILVVGTGRPFRDSVSGYIGSVQVVARDDGRYIGEIYHVFDCGESFTPPERVA